MGTLLEECLQKTKSNSLKTISCLKRVIDSLRLVDATETGQKEEVSSITTIRPSLSGSMKKISSESSPCNKEQTLELYSPDLQLLLVRLKRVLSSHMTRALVTSHLAQPTLVLPSGPQSIFSFLILDRKKMSLRKSQLNTSSRFEASMESTASHLTIPMTYPTREDLDVPRFSLSRTCMMASK